MPYRLDNIFVDDNLYVWVNGAVLYADPEGATPGERVIPPFNAQKGDTIRVMAVDWYGSCRRVSAVNLSYVNADNTVIAFELLDPGQDDGCHGWPSQTVFFDKTFTITIPSIPPASDEDARNELRRTCPVNPPGTSSTVISMSLLSDPVNVMPSVALSYNSASFDRAPSSMGFGWSLALNMRVEIDENDDLVFRNGSGGFERWTLQDGAWVPAHRDNYIEAVENEDESFTLTFPDQTRYNFATSGEVGTTLLTTIVDRNGNTATFEYDESSRLTQVSDGRGRFLYVSYGGRTDGQPVSIRAQDPDLGHQIQLEYYGEEDENAGRLQSIVDPAGETTRFAYGADHRLWQVTDPRDTVALTFIYYEDGRKQTETGYDQLTATYTYDDDLHTVTVEYEDLTAISDPVTRTTVTTFDEWQNVTGFEDALGNEYANVYGDPINPYLLTRSVSPALTTVRREYSAQGNLIGFTDQGGNVSQFEYADDIDQPLSPLHRNLLRKIHRPPVTTGEGLVQYAPTELLYDESGNLTQIKDALGQSVFFDIGDDGQPTRTTDRNGHTTFFGYSDPRGNLTSVKVPGDSAGVAWNIWTLGYDEYDQIVRMADPLANESTFDRDNDGRPIQVTSPLGKYTLLEWIDGLLDHVELPANAGSSSSRRIVSYGYDDPGRLLSVLRDISVETQQLRARYEYDGFSNLRTFARLRGGVEKSTTYDYDVLDRQISETDPLSRTSSWAYDPFCGQVIETTARGIVRLYSRNVRCLPTQRKTRNSNDEIEYDELRRPLTVRQSAGDGDRYGNAGARFGQSRFAAPPSSEERHFTYDPLDRIITTTYPDSSIEVREYDNEGNLTSLVDVHGHRTGYLYYEDNRLHTVTMIREGQDDRVFTYSYDRAGRPKQVQYPASTGIVAYFGETIEGDWVSGFDADGRLTTLRYMRTVDEVEGRLLELRYSYDDSGNRTQMIEIAADDSQIIWGYAYDWLDRLTGVSQDVGAGPVTVATYEYDESDNLVIRDEDAGTTTFEYDDANQMSLRKLDATTVESFAHDDDGNMVSRTLTAGSVTSSYEFDDLDCIVRFHLPGGTARNTYDATNLRKSSTALDGAATAFKYGSALPPMNETTTTLSGSFETNQVIADGLRAFERDGDFYYPVTDALGTVRLVVTDDGSTVFSASIGVWGDMLSVDDDVPGGMPYRFVGAYGVRHDADTGLHYMRQRWCDPGLQRFVSRDHVRSTNRYAYAANRPTVYFDPSGLAPGIYGSIEDRAKLTTAYNFLMYYLDRRYPEYAKYGQALNDAIIVRGTRGWVDPMSANARTDTCGGKARMFIFSENLEAEFTPEFLAWVLLHESVHVWQGDENLQPIVKEWRPNVVASDYVLQDMQRFYDTLTPMQKFIHGITRGRGTGN